MVNSQIYHCKFTTPGFVEYNERLQVFLKFFIDGASYVEHTDFWDYYILYKKDQVSEDIFFFIIISREEFSHYADFVQHTLFISVQIKKE